MWAMAAEGSRADNLGLLIPLRGHPTAGLATRSGLQPQGQVQGPQMLPVSWWMQGGRGKGGAVPAPNSGSHHLLRSDGRVGIREVGDALIFQVWE